MITNAIITWVVGGINAIVGLLPTTPNLGLSSAANNLANSGLWSHLAWLNNYVDIDALDQVLTWMFYLIPILVGFQAILWLLTALHITGPTATSD